MATPKVGRTKLARARKSLTKDELFFYENAGYSYDAKVETAEEGRIRCARELAKAEQYAQNLGLEFEWDVDELPWDAGDTDYVPNEVLCCRVFDPKDEGPQAHGTGYRYHSLASLCGIADPDANYRRVIEAELAAEAMAEVDEEIDTLDAH